MSNAIGFEVRLFFNAFLLGVILIFVYDFLRVFRQVVKHKKTHEAIEDTIYWIITGFIVFIMLYNSNDGVIRWFAIAGVSLGMFLYNISISKFFVKYVSIIVGKIIKVISKILHVLFKPVRYIFSRVYLMLKKLIKVLKSLCKSIKMKKKKKKLDGVKHDKKKKREKKH